MANALELKTAFNKDGTLKSIRWYRDQVRSLYNNVTPSKLMREEERLVRKIEPGSMYLFYYDPKLKAKLPFYDTFPLVLPFGTAEGGFLGLNLHYLPYMLRFNLLSRLMEYRNNKKMDDTTKIMASWKILNGASTSSLVKPCVKHYLSNHVGSRFLRISADEWATTIMLPVENFQKATNQEVWNDSKRKAGI